MKFFLLINIKMPTIVGILIFISRKISCSTELSEFYNLESRQFTPDSLVYPCLDEFKMNLRKANRKLKNEFVYQGERCWV